MNNSNLKLFFFVFPLTDTTMRVIIGHPNTFIYQISVKVIMESKVLPVFHIVC